MSPERDSVSFAFDEEQKVPESVDGFPKECEHIYTSYCFVFKLKQYKNYSKYDVCVNKKTAESMKLGRFR